MDDEHGKDHGALVFLEGWLGSELSLLVTSRVLNFVSRRCFCVVNSR